MVLEVQLVSNVPAERPQGDARTGELGSKLRVGGSVYNGGRDQVRVRVRAREVESM